MDGKRLTRQIGLETVELASENKASARDSVGPGNKKVKREIERLRLQRLAAGSKKRFARAFDQQIVPRESRAQFRNDRHLGNPVRNRNNLWSLQRVTSRRRSGYSVR